MDPIKIDPWRIFLRPKFFGLMTSRRKKDIDGRWVRKRARDSYKINIEEERERKRISYEKKQFDLGKITKQNLMKKNAELESKLKFMVEKSILRQ